jgi:hypothetical protein
MHQDDSNPFSPPQSKVANDLPQVSKYKLSRTKRVLIELFIPPLLGSAPFWLIAVFSGGGLNGVIFILFIAYLVALVPSLLFTVALEIAFSMGLDPRNSKAIWFAGFLGLAAGTACAAVFKLGKWLIILGPIGAVVGLAIGLIVWWRSTPTTITGSSSPQGAA